MILSPEHVSDRPRPKPRPWNSEALFFFWTPIRPVSVIFAHKPQIYARNSAWQNRAVIDTSGSILPEGYFTFPGDI